MDTNRERVLQCIIDLANQRRPAARVLIAQLLNLKLSIVDDAVKRLKEDGLVRPVVPGIFEPVPQHPPSRPISKTVLTDGTTVLEIGDTCENLTPHEAQVMGMLFHGDAVSMTYWAEERRTGEQIVRLESQLRALTKAYNDLQRRLAGSLRGAAAGQGDLFGEPAPARARPVRRRGAHVLA